MVDTPPALAGEDEAEGWPLRLGLGDMLVFVGETEVLEVGDAF